MDDAASTPMTTAPYCFPDSDLSSNRTAPTVKTGEWRYLGSVMSPAQFTHLRRTESGMPATRTTDDIMAEWNALVKNFQALQTNEKDVADKPALDDVSADMLPLCEPIYARSHIDQFRLALGTRIELIELDKLIVHQPAIDMDYVLRIGSAIRPGMTGAELFRLCFSNDDCLAPIKVRRDADQFVFTSESNDLRFLDLTLLDPDQAVGFPGRQTNVIALSVGYSENPVSAVYRNGRIFLCNGSHRLIALYVAGYRRVPCIVMYPKTVSEERLTGIAPVFRSAVHVQGPRPPLLRDYLDPLLSASVQMPQSLRQLKVSVTVQIEDVSMC